MKTRHAAITLFTVLLTSLAVGQALAVTKGRIMTNGKVLMHKNNKVVAAYTNQGPIDENALMECRGNCMVKMQGIALSVVDQTRFALKESQESLNLYVENGKIYFILSDTAHSFAFFTPDGHFIKSEGFIAPASTGSAIKGSIEVTDSATIITMDTGSMLVRNGDTTETIMPGRSLVLAMANPTAEEEDGDKEGALVPCPMFDWGCKTVVQKGIIIAAGVGAAAGTAIIIDNSTGGGTSASPNQ